MSSYYPGNDVELGMIVGADKPVMLSRRDRARHTYIVGGSRTGKTKLMEGMCRQDLLHWPDHRCSMVVIDPHDTLYDGLMGYAAAEGLKEWPIIPLDLRRDDFVVSYDLLMKRDKIKPAVVCRGFVEAIIHAWGQSNTHDTPRLASTLLSILMAVYEKECTLSQALAFMYDPQLRKTLSADLQHQVSRATLHNAQALGEKGFQETMQSMMYRINGFLTTQILEATLCSRTGQSLDLDEVFAKGKILLVSLSTAGGNISTADAWAFGSVLLTDLWSAAKRRGKAEEGQRAPCYVHIDEFQNFLTPDIAVGLTEASGFGLHLTMGHQYPSQLPDRGGDLGKMILNAVLATAKNKMAFQLEHPEDLDLLARVIGRQLIDLDKVKQEIWSTKVTGYKLAYLPAFSDSTTEGTAHSQNWSETHTEGRTVTDNWSESVGVSAAVGVSDGYGENEEAGSSQSSGTTEGRGDSLARSKQQSVSKGATASQSEGAQWGSGHATSAGSSSREGMSQSEALRFGPMNEHLQGELSAYKEGQLAKEEEANFERKRPRDLTLTQGRSADEATSQNEQTSASSGGNKSSGLAQTESTSDGTGETATHNESHSRNESLAESESCGKSRNHNTSLTAGISSVQSVGGGESVSEQLATSYGEGTTESKSRTNAISWNPILIPILEKELASRERESKDDQLFRIEQFLDAQPDRHCFVRLASDRMPVQLYTKTIEPPRTTNAHREQWVIRRLKKIPFVLTMEAALRQIEEGTKRLKAKANQVGPEQESAEARRPIRPPDRGPEKHGT